MRNKNKQSSGFTLIELLVVIAIIGLLSSLALIATMQARQKARDAKRLGDMTQMNNALELYFSTYKGYPSITSNGVPVADRNSIVTIPTAPMPPDGTCIGMPHSAACIADDPNCSGVPANTYYYITSGTAYLAPDGVTQVYPDYLYYFCLGNQTGNFAGGERILTPRGMR